MGAVCFRKNCFQALPFHYTGVCIACSATRNVSACGVQIKVCVREYPVTCRNKTRLRISTALSAQTTHLSRNGLTPSKW